MKAELKTSRNQVSRNIKRLADRGETSVLVYGCGRFVNEVCEKVGVAYRDQWDWYEPHVKGLDTVPKGTYENVILDNVLNVIEGSLVEVLKGAWSKVSDGGKLHINIYEGNKTGVGQFDSSKCQRNEKVSTYRGLMSELGCVKTIEGVTGGFVITKQGFVDWVETFLE